MSPNEYCKDKAAKSGSSFYYSFLFLPEARRQAITALYAFCREVDDIVDDCTDVSVAHSKLAWWRQEIGRLYQGTGQHPVSLALQPHLQAFTLQQRYFIDIIDGMEMDLQQSRYLDFQGLKKYCYHVASAVGLLACEIFGRTQEQTLVYAENLGLALQLTNIIRDVGEDARRGRIYLPVNELQQFGVKVADINANLYSPAFSELMKFQAKRAHDAYDAALAALPKADQKSQRPGLMMAKIYRTLLEEIERDGFHVLHQRISLTPIRKLWLAWKTFVF